MILSLFLLVLVTLMIASFVDIVLWSTFFYFFIPLLHILHSLKLAILSLFSCRRTFLTHTSLLLCNNNLTSVL